MKKHSITSFNKYLCLKPNALMVLISLFLFKPFIVTASSVIYRGDSSALISLFYPSKMILSLEAAAAVPLLFLLFAATKRVPDATELVRNIWRNGKMLIMITAFFQLCITSSPLWLWLPVNNIMTRTSWLLLAMYLLIIIITFFSTYMRDCFACFPEKNNN